MLFSIEPVIYNFDFSRENRNNRRIILYLITTLSKLLRFNEIATLRMEIDIKVLTNLIEIIWRKLMAGFTRDVLIIS